MGIRVLTIRVLMGWIACTLLAACSESETPEARIRRAVAEMVDAVEAKDIARLKDFVADDYRDAGGRDRRELAQLVTFHTMRNRSVHVMARVRSVTFPESGRAQVVVVAATAGRPIDTTDLAALRADVYHFDVDMVEQGDEWQVIWAQWRPVPASELL